MFRSLASVLLACIAATAQTAQTPTPPELQNGALPAVSPNGSHVAFFSNRTGMFDLFVIQAEGTAELQLTKSTERESFAGWFSDSKRIAFSILKDDRSTIYSVDISGQKQQQIGAVTGRSPMLSPDGKRAVYMVGPWTSMKLIVSALDGTEARQLNDGTSIAWNYHWSPDGKRIAFTGRETRESELAIFVINADGSDRRRITNLPTEEGGAQWPVWSRDARQLAVQVSSRTHKGIAHIYVVDVATGEARKLNTHTEVYVDETPFWFPDSRIAFQSNRTGTMEVWSMNADGTSARQITGRPQSRKEK